jgi:hypothetical protein
MHTFSERLLRCMSAADMTVADLTIWFDRPRSTVDTWVKLRRRPMGPSGRCAEDDLTNLEHAIYNGFKIPPRFGREARSRCVLEQKDAYPTAGRTLSKHHPAK